MAKAMVVIGAWAIDSLFKRSLIAHTRGHIKQDEDMSWPKCFMTFGGIISDRDWPCKTMIRRDELGEVLQIVYGINRKYTLQRKASYLSEEEIGTFLASLISVTVGLSLSLSLSYFFLSVCVTIGPQKPHLH